MLRVNLNLETMNGNEVNVLYHNKEIENADLSVDSEFRLIILVKE